MYPMATPYFEIRRGIINGSRSVLGGYYGVVCRPHNAIQFSTAHDDNISGDDPLHCIRTLTSLKALTSHML